MPIIEKDSDGNIVKKGSNGCSDCGLPGNNTKIILASEDLDLDLDDEETLETEEENQYDY